MADRLKHRHLEIDILEDEMPSFSLFAWLLPWIEFSTGQLKHQSEPEAQMQMQIKRGQLNPPLKC